MANFISRRGIFAMPVSFTLPLNLAPCANILALLSISLFISAPSFAAESPYVLLADASGKTQLVLKNSTAVLYFTKSLDTEWQDAFNGLSPSSQQRVLAYYEAGKSEQSDKKIFTRGLYGIILLYANKELAEKLSAELKNTGTVSSNETPTSVFSYAKRARNAFPSAGTYIGLDAKEVADLDSGIIDVTMLLTAEKK